MTDQTIGGDRAANPTSAPDGPALPRQPDPTPAYIDSIIMAWAQVGIPESAVPWLLRQSADDKDKLAAWSVREARNFARAHQFRALAAALRKRADELEKERRSDPLAP